MGIKGKFFKGLLIVLVLALIPVAALSAQKVTPGSACKTVNQKVKYLNKTYTCIKSGKKYVWNKGAATATPTPTPTPAPTATSSPTPTTKPIELPSSGSPCKVQGETFTSGGTPLVCRLIAGGIYKYFELTKSFTTASNPISPDKLATCRLTDQRPQPVQPEGTFITYPIVPHVGSVKSGIEKIAVVGFDFSDSPGQGNPLDILGNNLERAGQFFNWYSNGKVKFEFTTYDKWIRLSQPSRAYVTGEHFTSTTGAMTVTDMAQEFNSAINKYINLSGYTAVFFVYPKTIETITQNYGLAAGWNGLPAFYGVGPSYYPVEFPYWTYIIHEMLHEQGLQGHSPKAPWRFGVLLNGNGYTAGMNSWDELAADWITEDEIYCIDKANLKPVQISLAPIERQQAGVHTIMIKLDNHRALVIESHRQGDFAQGMPEYGYGITLQLVDTTKMTSWDNDTNVTSVYLKVSNYQRYGPEYGTRLNNKFADDSGTNLFNGIGVSGARWGLDQNFLLLEGEKYTLEGITIDFLNSGNTDLISLSN
ncbi:unannotated protein [freshwater metagenome]|uniref:Unannotated protein n=1 Tax=freshwater metagenome TaxID=449393 RepID=A0A6J6S507_9ZZZZ